MGSDWLASASGDAPVCTYELDEGAGRGCEEGCLNRSLGATLATAVIDCGRKGVGVIALEDAAEGCLVGEYVGELLGRQDAQLRSQLYRDARHSCMMQINNDAVIDATRIGGRMRFVNHSCDPNCQVEKWCVRGQERCGLFVIANKLGKTGRQ
ncbi:hypothetical protein V7S43_004207 [Phytophthora oleae]|uniref:SET domain-containing protein n=1 Tax=Phytophthora oleae TaxID=2107226 RepID=A0ABD3FW92_9STRA